MPVVSLRDVVEALDLQSDELQSFLDPDTGEIITFSDEEASIAESDDWEDAPEWMREFLPKVKRALEDERMLELPDQVHIDEWRMMQDFALENEQCRCRTELISAIHGEGRFAVSSMRFDGWGWRTRGSGTAQRPSSRSHESGWTRTGLSIGEFERPPAKRKKAGWGTLFCKFLLIKEWLEEYGIAYR